jgi:hypothetical protein
VVSRAGVWSLVVALSIPATCGAATPAADLEEIVVRADRLAGPTRSAGEETVSADQLENRPVLRPAEVLEVIPGLVVTQHSGDGKANQYFLRGFNLDHGTDFATQVDGVPVNLPSHAHGQGYTDLNFLIPELVDHIDYRKGPYYAEDGDFSAAGAADIRYRRRLAAPFVTAAAGAGGLGRLVAAASPEVASGDLLLAAETFHNDGPWQLREGFTRLAAVARFTAGDERDGYSVEATGYDGHWRSTDQVPLRAVARGDVGRFGTVDPTDGGRTARYVVSAERRAQAGGGQWRASIYAIDYRLDLRSDFTYATDPLHGDQFEQSDRRHVVGGSFAYRRPGSVRGLAAELVTGIEVRGDDIAPVGLYRTQQGVRYATLREDAVQQAAVAAYASETLRLTPWLRGDLGVRADRVDLRVRSSLASNSGHATDAITSPKLTLVLGPWSGTELFLNAGRGFHSNDARGATIRVDPADGVTPVARVTPLVGAIGEELGICSTALPNLRLALSAWTLRLDSELLYAGDGGTTEPSRASRRGGVELGIRYAPAATVVVDADLAWTRARFAVHDLTGDAIPNALGRVASVGATLSRDSGWFGGARARYFGPAPLTTDGRVRSAATLMVSLDAGYHFSAGLSATVTVFNALDRRDNDISYYYASRLPGEATPVRDIHVHPVEPRALRVALTMKF